MRPAPIRHLRVASRNIDYHQLAGRQHMIFAIYNNTRVFGRGGGGGGGGGLNYVSIIMEI